VMDDELGRFIHGIREVCANYCEPQILVYCCLETTYAIYIRPVHTTLVKGSKTGHETGTYIVFIQCMPRSGNEGSFLTCEIVLA
jgi:hypothetical protein